MFSMRSGLAAIGLALAFTGSALGQAIDALNMFNGVIGIIAQQANQKAWQNIDPQLLSCADDQLARQGVSLNSLVRNGVSPNDPRLSAIWRDCSQGTSQAGTMPAGDTSAILDDLEQALGPGGPKATPVDDTEPRRQLVALRQTIVTSPAANTTLAVRTDQLIREIDATLAGVVSENAVERLQRLSANLQAAIESEQAWTRLYSTALDRRKSADDVATSQLPAGLAQEKADLEFDMGTLIATANAPTELGAVYSLPALSCDGADPVDALICQDSTARWARLDYIRADYLMRRLYPQVAEARAAAMANFRKDLIRSCKIVEALHVAQKAEASITCVTTAFQRKSKSISLEVRKTREQAAIEEMNRPIAEHLQLQGTLRDLGFLPLDEEIDGRYGSHTRSAIEQFQTTKQLTVNGMMNDSTARSILSEAKAAPLHGATQLAALQSLVSRYDAFLVKVEETKRQARLAIERSGNVARARTLLAGYLPTELRAFLERYVGTVGQEQPDADAAEQLDREFAIRQAQMKLAERVISLVGDGSRRLVEQPGGYVALYNSSPVARGVTRKLDGQLSFDNDHLRVCAEILAAPDQVERAIIRQMFLSFGAMVRLPVETCDEQRLEEYDLVLVQPGTEDLSRMVFVLAAIDDGVLREVAHLTSDQVSDEISRRADRIAAAKSEIGKGTDVGYGFIGLMNGSSTICAIGVDTLDKHLHLLGEHDDDIRDELNAAPQYVQKTLEDAFVASKQQQCGAVYASTADLQKMANGLDRDHVDHDVWPIWFDEVSIAQSEQEWAAQQAAAAEQSAKQARELADKKAIEEAKSSEHEALRQRQQAALRTQYGAQARALELRLKTELADFLGSTSQTTPFGKKYPPLALSYSRLIADHWELMSQETALLDYGVGEFKGRQLDIGIARSTVKIRNRILGEYKELCFITAFVDDVEFAMEREPFGMECDLDPSLLTKYEQGEKFQSRWIVE